MSDKERSYKPRKTPAQARSTFTVDAIFEGCIQVLLKEGQEGLTTTKVAERAGVSVGTLYQYFGNKKSLLASVMSKHLCAVVEKVESACLQNKGAELDRAVSEVVCAFFDAKMERRDVSRALYLVAGELEGEKEIIEMTLRGQLAICTLLSHLADVKIEDPHTVSFLMGTALTGPVQMLLALEAPVDYVEKIRDEAITMIKMYLLSKAESL